MKTNLKKYMVILIIVSSILLTFALPAYSDDPPVTAPRVTVTYSDETESTVAVTLTWKAENEVNYTVEYADSIKEDGKGLDYKSVNVEMPGQGIGKTEKIVLHKYRNYFFEITARKGATEVVSNVRIYPVSSENSEKPGVTNKNVHTNYDENTASCAWCHTNHASLKAQLLNETTYYQLCKLCHGTASTQSKYDVESGQITMGNGETKPSLAGPFVEGVTSSHNANDDAPGWGAVAVPGSDSDKKLKLTCVSCHDVHSKPDDNYRMLKKTIYGSDDKSIKHSIEYKAYAVTRNDSDYPFGEELFMVKGNTEFCASCHLNYDDGNAKTPGKDELTVGQAVYMHPTSESVFIGGKDYRPRSEDKLPLQYKEGEGRSVVVCSTCHFAHGTTKQFNTPEGQNKNMLRLDNYGVCESCHKK